MGDLIDREAALALESQLRDVVDGSDGWNPALSTYAAALLALPSATQAGGMTPKQAATTCPKCGGPMRPGIAMGQTYTGGMPDFGPDDEVRTFSAGGPGEVVQVRKCAKCGHSTT